MVLLSERSTGVAGCLQFSKELDTYSSNLEFIKKSLPIFSRVLALVSDKKSRQLNNAAKQTCKDFMSSVSKDMMAEVVAEVLVKEGICIEAKWQSKVCALELLADAAVIAPREIESIMVTLVPAVTEAMWDTKRQVKEQAITTMEAICKTIDNVDLAPFIPELISAILDPDEVSDCVYALAGTTFVQTVTASALSITVPILSRGFKERKTAVIRKVAVITENLSKLVRDASDVAPFMPILEPQLARGVENISDPECAERFAKAHAQLLKASVSTSVKTMHVDEDDGEDENVADLCDIHFSLAYGSNILLNDSRLHLKKGYKYGVIANKSAGKTTMMRAIANYQVEGFPTADQLRCIFIENDIQGSQQEMNVAEFIVDSIGFDIKLTISEAKEALKEGGFTDVMCAGLITQLSGGWKMKLALIRATLEKADIMLMDEPTNHLDVLNVQWCVDYINSLPNVTCLIVSHDTQFLDNVVDHIIHFKDLKLHSYKGNISKFVERFPEASSYFDLKSTTLKFSFPKPTALQQGSSSNRGRTLMEMKNVSFAYPGAAKNQVNNVSVKASMASRVAIVGANGAGKSTLIKLLVGELKPSSGEIKVHPNMRFAYVAQHAFHHVEQHLDKSPNEYLCWRYEFGEDKEAENKVALEITPEEKAVMKKPFEVQFKDETTGTFKKEKRVLEKLVSRRKDKKSFMYEIKWEKHSMDHNSWYPRQSLENRGFIKLLMALDARLAAAESMQHRQLTRGNVTKHLAEVGLDEEEANHSRIRDLSGGQKVKVVMAACTWACPHLIILDEPTNYLDRDSLGALANALLEFEGGVCLITHNKEFADRTCRETWVVANNRCDVKGDPEWEKYAAEVHAAEDNFGDVDALGNKIDKTRVKKVSEMSRGEIRDMKKKMKRKVKSGEELEIFEIEYCEAWKIKWD